MKTTQEKIAIMQAFADGKEIEITPNSHEGIWTLCKEPNWDWPMYDYRVKEEPKEPKYIPFTFEDAEFLIGKVVKSKGKNWVEIIAWCGDISTSVDNYETLLSDYIFLDGSPCGKLKQ